MAHVSDFEHQGYYPHRLVDTDTMEDTPCIEFKRFVALNIQIQINISRYQCCIMVYLRLFCAYCVCFWKLRTNMK